MAIEDFGAERRCSAYMPGLAVKGLHMQELRDRLKEARDILAFPALTYAHTNVNPATNGGLKFPILCDDIASLRGGVQ